MADKTAECDTVSDLYRLRGLNGPATRLIASYLALAIGTLRIAMLWLEPLSMPVLVDAGRGAILLLLALGLMGSERLSLVVTIVVTTTAIFQLSGAIGLGLLPPLLELALLVLAAIALLKQPSNRDDSRAVT